MNQIEIGKFIAECRKSKNMTQNQLAEMLNITNKSISKWENGSCLPDPSLYEPLCDILGITINELFAGQRIEKEDYQRMADANLMRMLKYKLYYIQIWIYFNYTSITSKKQWILKPIIWTFTQKKGG